LRLLWRLYQPAPPPPIAPAPTNKRADAYPWASPIHVSQTTATASNEKRVILPSAVVFQGRSVSPSLGTSPVTIGPSE
jgi:hypothetical protein